MQRVQVIAPNFSDLPDHELVSLAQRGVPAAFRAIMQRHNRSLYRVARAILRDESEAEDALQEAYLRAFSGLHGFRHEASLTTWLTRIIINEALGRKRRRKATVELEAIDMAVQQGDSTVIMFRPAAGETDPEAAAARAEARRMVERAIDELPDAFRVVFIMRDVEEMSIEETAGHLGIRPETVKTRLHRARKLLRKSLDDKFASVLSEAFPFAGTRCARITDTVLERLGLPSQ